MQGQMRLTNKRNAWKNLAVSEQITYSSVFISFFVENTYCTLQIFSDQQCNQIFYHQKSMNLITIEIFQKQCPLVSNISMLGFDKVLR